MNESTKVVTRFAPAPTGFLHIGGARTAIFNYLYSCTNNGKFFLRIDDTDQERSDHKCVQQIIESLKWLGLTWDNEGKEMYQSSRFDLYLKVAEDLIDSGKAYRCYVNDKDAELIREIPDLKERKHQLRTVRSSDSFTIRFMMPESEVAFVRDTIAGDTSINSDDLDDFVMIRKDGTPTYMIASVVDDQEMETTNIIRGNEHLTNTHRQIFLMKALGYRTPIFTHVPLINNEQKQKLSKRDGAVSIDEYREMGILPEAMFNYVLRLGWSMGNKEVISIDEAKSNFNLKALRGSAACFDLKKLLWLNSQYIRLLPGAELLRRANITGKIYDRGILCIEDIKKKHEDLRSISDICNKIFSTDRIELIDELPEVEEKEIDFLGRLDFSFLNFSSIEDIKSSLTNLITQIGVDKKETMMFLRVALTGLKISPGLFDIIFALGRDVSQMRLLDALLKANEKKLLNKNITTED